MRDVPTMLRTSRANRRRRHLALILGAAASSSLSWGLFLLFSALFLWVIWRAV